MYQKLINSKFEIIPCSRYTSLYYTESEGIKTYVASHPNTRNLLCKQELLGYELPEAFVAATKDVLFKLCEANTIKNTNILYILRGGLNFPIEKSCLENNIPIEAISMISSERVFINNKISEIETKYKKIICINEATVIIGDIVASGETMANAINSLVKVYNENNISLKRIIVFTIGTYNTLDILSKINKELLNHWKGFEGITLVFYEGIFNVYRTCGISNLNLPFVDFVCCNGFIAPEYRYELIKKVYPIYEKCLIYDGGERRFEKQNHIYKIKKYWNELFTVSKSIDIGNFLEEKLGSTVFTTYSEWLNGNNYDGLPNCKSLYKDEIKFLNEQSNEVLVSLCETRAKQLEDLYKTN